MPRYPIEPFRIKMVEPIRRLSRSAREAALRAVGYNARTGPTGAALCRVYTQAHLDDAVAVLARLAARREQVRGYRFTYAPGLLRHFTARFAPLSAD